MENEKERSKIREPYTPEGTPNPPQIIDPSSRDERKEKDKPDHNKTREAGNESKPTHESEDGKEKLLGESETEIDDETTI